MESLTPSQQHAVAARGNVLVMAGAGTGKTRTLVERALDCLAKERVALDEILIVTFTEAAATEMRARLRRGLEKKSRAHPDDMYWNEQIALFDAACIGTLHSFCLRLIREHFYDLGLDPQLTIMDEGATRLLADETLDEQFQSHYEGQDEFSIAVQDFIKVYGNGRDEKIRALVLRLHHYAQTRPDTEGWLTKEIKNFSSSDPIQWRECLGKAVSNWRDEWILTLENLRTENSKAAECQAILKNFPETALPELLKRILATDGKENFPPKKFTALRKPLEEFFDDAVFLNSLAATNGNDPVAEDWNWIRFQMKTLVRLAEEFAAKFSGQKRNDGVLDFHDLEQFALKLLWDFKAKKPTVVAEHWRKKIKFVFVDEYQDINAAQDKIISALSREGLDANRFLVGDVKQSIYRFRLADPNIFRDYAADWHGKSGQTIPLSDNFRSRESLLNFINSFFGLLMKEEINGINYDSNAKLKFGSPETRSEISVSKNQLPRAELLVRLKKGNGNSEVENGDDSLADMEESEKEARMLALRLRELKNSAHEIWDDDRKVFRPVDWRDMAVLLRSPSGKSEIFAKQFERAGISLVVERGGFYDSSEILDLLSLLQLLDNPLQDVPCIAVLRSPLVGLSLDELAEIRLSMNGKFWFALSRFASSESKATDETQAKAQKFLKRFRHWRKIARQSSLSQCLEEILAETRYDDWLRTRPRGAQRNANIGRFLNLAQRFDQFQRQGLFRFLKFIEAQREREIEPEVAAVAEENAVRLMSIHQSKGLEFPVVALADLAKPFNEQDLRSEIILDEKFGLCPRVKPPMANGRYPSLSYWLAQKNQRRELRGEELRLFYVAMTRARDTLILTGSITEKKWRTDWKNGGAVTAKKILAAKNYADWFALWFGQQGKDFENAGELPHLHWRVIDDNELSIAEVEKPESKIILPELDAQNLRRLREISDWKYRLEAATKRAAKTSVTVLRKQAMDDLDDEAEKKFSNFQFRARRVAKTNPQLNAADSGVAHHKFLQHFSIENATDLKSFQAEAQKLLEKNYLSPDELTCLKLENITAFWNSPVGKTFRENARFIKRELPFTAKFSPRELDDLLGTKSSTNLEDEFVVVQGVADLAVLLPKEILLVDFKTDDVAAKDVPGKIKIYAPQLKLYARALEKIYVKPVTNCWLHFFAVGKTVEVKP